MNSLKEEANRLREIARTSLRDAALLESIQVSEEVKYALGYGCGILIDVEPTHALKVVSAVLQAVGHKRAEKEFDESTGTVIYKIPHPDTTACGGILVKAGPPQRCRMELVEEEVMVPAQPAHKEIRKRYKLTDPACLQGETPTT